MRSVCVVIIVAASLAVAPPAGGVPETGLRVARATLDDRVGDGRGPDIGAGSFITNDNAGNITFGLRIQNRTGFVGDELYGALIDADKNPATGVAGGEYLVRARAESAQILRYADSAAAAIRVEWAPGFGPVMHITRELIENIDSFNVVLIAALDNSFNGLDIAPDINFLAYQLAPLRLVPSRATVGRARAGRAFSVQMRVVRSDLESPLAEGTVACTARLGKRALAGRGRFAGGRVVCTWRLPSNARGRKLAGSITVTFQNVRASRRFVVTVS